MRDQKSSLKATAWRFDRLTKHWFALRAKLGAGPAMYGLMLGMTILGFALVIAPSLAGAPKWISYPLMIVGALVILISHLFLALCLDATFARLPGAVVGWITNHAYKPSNTDYREMAARIHWKVPRHVGMLEDDYLKWRLNPSLHSHLSKMQLSETPEVKRDEAPRRL